LLAKYGWYFGNSKQRTWPVGGKKPNDLGLFDMHGNTYTWCQERYQDYPEAKGDEATDDKEDSGDIDDKDIRVLRGGSYGDWAGHVRSAYRNRIVPTLRLDSVGFRPARTLTP
jgi:formylglycine-generating enzyme required for sulfatase activity